MKPNDLEAKHSLKELQAMARERGISPSGTKRNIAKRLAIAGPDQLNVKSEDKTVRSVPMTMSMPDEVYSWEYLIRSPYGTMVWDIVLINGHKYVAFLVREPEDQVEKLPDPIDVHWKGISLGVTLGGRRVMPLVVLADVLPLGSVYEIWFNFYGEGQVESQEAIYMLGHQSHLFLFFLDRSPDPTRKIVFPNSVNYFFRGHYGMLSNIPEWTDSDFNSAKRQLQAKYSVADLWRMT